MIGQWAPGHVNLGAMAAPRGDQTPPPKEGNHGNVRA